MRKSNITELKNIRHLLRKLAVILERIHDNEIPYSDELSIDERLSIETDEEFNKRVKLLNISDKLNEAADMLSLVISDRINPNISKT